MEHQIPGIMIGPERDRGPGRDAVGPRLHKARKASADAVAAMLV